jgi:NAD(P)-dependent dehydrogenase (short-subunit alcohol dehydrogenase family)
VPGWLEGKRIFATGAGSGIGRGAVEAFLAEGASVCALELSEAKCDELDTLGNSLVACCGDATSAADNRRAVETAVDRFGGLDVLATFVGVFDNYTHLLDLPEDRFDDAFREMYDVNVRSVLLAVRAAGAHLQASRGSIIITGSSSSFFPGRGGTLYVSSKFALRGLVVQLAHELAPDVRVNGVAPGGTLSTDLRGLRSLDLADVRLTEREGREEALRKRTPLSVALEPADHAGAYILLASDRAPGVTGEIIRSDGGLSVR